MRTEQEWTIGFNTFFFKLKINNNNKFYNKFSSFCHVPDLWVDPQRVGFCVEDKLVQADQLVLGKYQVEVPRGFNKTLKIYKRT